MDENDSDGVVSQVVPGATIGAQTGEATGDPAWEDWGNWNWNQNQDNWYGQWGSTPERPSGGGGGGNDLMLLEDFSGADVTRYRTWRRKVKMWQLCSRMGKDTRGPGLMLKLKGEAWNQCERIDENDLCSDGGVEAIIGCLDKVYDEAPEIDLLSRMDELLYGQEARRRKDEPMQNYIARMLQLFDKLAALKAELPELWRGFILWRRSGLERTDRNNILTYTRGSMYVRDIAGALRKYADLARADKGDRVKEHGGHHERHQRSGGNGRFGGEGRHGGRKFGKFSSRGVYLAEGESGSDIEEGEAEDGEMEELDAMVSQTLDDMGVYENDDDVDSDAFDDDDAKEALLSQYERVRKEIKDKRNARGFKKSGPSGTSGSTSSSSVSGKVDSFRVDIQALKQKTRCKNCNELGHWQRECPKKDKRLQQSRPGKGGGRHSANLAETEFTYLAENAHDLQEQTFTMENFFSVSGSEDRSAARGRDSQYKVYVAEVGDESEEWCLPALVVRTDSWDSGVVDTACGRMLIGAETLKHLIPKIEERYDCKVRFSKEANSFRFGNDGKVRTEVLVHLPAQIANNDVELRVAVIPGGAPLLISKSFLKKVQAVIDLDRDEITCRRFGCVLPLATGASGH